MATLSEIEDAIRVAAGKGNKELVRKLGAAREQMIAKGVGGGKPAAPPATEGTDDPGLLQQMFDVRNAGTGESYIYGNRPKPQVVDDLMQMGAETASRGLTDKLNNTANLTANARERTPDYIEAPLDIATSLVTSPYKVAGMGAGAAYGALEGAANAYGHQKGWTPDLENMGWEAGKGALYGAGGAKAGEWLGKLGNAFKKPVKIGTEDELMDAADRAAKRQAKGRNISSRSEDIIARNARMDAAKIANAEGQGGFEKMLAGLDEAKWPRNERELLTRLANPQSLVGRMVEGAGNTLRRRAPHGLAAMLGTGIQATGGAINAAKKGVGDFNKLTESILDTTGELAKRATNVDFSRDMLSKLLVAADKAPEGNKKKKRR